MSIIKAAVLARIAAVEGRREIEGEESKIRVIIYQPGEETEVPDVAGICVWLPDNGRGDGL